MVFVCFCYRCVHGVRISVLHSVLLLLSFRYKWRERERERSNQLIVQLIVFHRCTDSFLQSARATMTLKLLNSFCNLYHIISYHTVVCGARPAVSSPFPQSSRPGDWRGLSRDSSCGALFSCHCRQCCRGKFCSPCRLSNNAEQL